MFISFSTLEHLKRGSPLQAHTSKHLGFGPLSLVVSVLRLLLLSLSQVHFDRTHGLYKPKT